MFLQIETATQPMHVGGLAIFEGEPFFDEEGRFRIEDARATIASRLHLVPRFRRKLMSVALDQGRPVWVDDDHFDLHYHVRLTALPKPGGPAQLRTLMERLQSLTLDRHRPLWEIWFVEGLEGGRVALIQKTHHALIDGISGIDVATVLLDFEPDAEPIEAPDWEPQPPPSSSSLLLESMTEMITGPTEVLRSAVQAVRRPDQAADSVLDRTVEAGRTLVNAATPAPPTPWNEPIGPERRFEIARIPLGRVKRTKDAVGASVNDVVLAVCAGALRSFLQGRGEDVEGLLLQALVPVSVRSEEEHLALGNRVSGMLAELPVGESDPKRRLLDVASHMSSLKESGQAEAADRLLALTGFAPPTIVGLAARLLVRQRTVNLGITNVPGPQQPLYCMGARLLEAFPYVGVFEAMGLMIGLISYDGQLGFGITGDRRHLPDLEKLANAIEEESIVLEGAVT